MTHGSHEELAAFVGIDWADATPAVCLQAAGSQHREACLLEHMPATIDAWVRMLRTRFHGQPIAICLALNIGPILAALRQYDFLGLLPINPMTVARSREAFAPSRATDAPTNAALQRDLLLTHRDTLQPLQPQRPTMRALAQLVEHRRRVSGEKVRITNRLPSTLKNYCPQELPWLQEQNTLIFGAVLRRWPPLNAAQRARRATLGTFFRDHQGRSAAIIDTRIHALKAAMPWPTDEGVSAPHALLGQPLVRPRRVAVPAIEDFDTAIAQRAQHHPDFPCFQALPGAGPVFASRLLVAFGAQRTRSASAAALQQ